MSIDRRDLLKAGIAASAAGALPRAAGAEVRFAPESRRWRVAQLSSRDARRMCPGASVPGFCRRSWLVNERDWFKSLGSDWTSNGRVTLAREIRRRDASRRMGRRRAEPVRRIDPDTFKYTIAAKELTSA
jgi:hypothetical protein